MIPRHFQNAIETIKRLERNDRYQGAFIFGSVVRDEITEDSDLDVKVVIEEENPCGEISHPFIEGIKLDITFNSQHQLAQQTKAEENSGRIPMIAESIILFDKKGFLGKLKESALNFKPRKYLEKDFKAQQFIIYHANNKVERNIVKDPYSALLSMNHGMGELLKTHYGIHGRWRVSDKRVFADLENWDRSLAELLRKFLIEHEVQRKFNWWKQIVDYIVKPMGGRMEIEDNVCNCKVCEKDLQYLEGVEQRKRIAIKINSYARS